MATGPALILGDQVFPLNKVTNSIGRKDRITNMVPDVDLATLDQERAVSRKHAEANYLDGQMMLRDIGSTNGTLVNDERLQLQVDRAMTDGDRISLGGFEMVFAAAAAWPEGVEAEWPSAEAPPEDRGAGPRRDRDVPPGGDRGLPAGGDGGDPRRVAWPAVADLVCGRAGRHTPEADVRPRQRAEAEAAARFQLRPWRPRKH